MKFPYKIIDLTHTLSPSIPTWNGGCGFQHETVLDYADCTTEVKFRTQKLNMQAGIGTHMDAPAHCIPGGKCIAELDLNDLIAPCVVIDVSHKSHERYSVSPEDILEFELQHGTIKPKSFVIVRTGWEKFWSDPEKYRNNLVFPCLSGSAAYLLMEHQIVGLGIDTLSPDRPEDGFPVHQILLSGGKYIVENVVNSGNIPPVGCYSLALPLKIHDGTEAPMRLIGLI